MLHSPIFMDPAAAQAVADFRETVISIRGHSLRAFYLPESSAERAVEVDAIADLTAGMQARCDRIDLTLDQLFALINVDLRRAGGAASRPTGEFSHALTRAATDAHAAERAAHEALTAAQQQLAVATADRLAADRACAGYAAQWNA